MMMFIPYFPLQIPLSNFMFLLPSFFLFLFLFICH